MTNPRPAEQPGHPWHDGRADRAVVGALPVGGAAPGQTLLEMAAALKGQITADWAYRLQRSRRAR